MPAALELQRELGDSCQVLLVERRHTLPEVEERWRERGWGESSALWTVGKLFETERTGVPNYLLLSPEGKVVMMGHPTRDAEAIRSYLQGFARSSEVSEG